VENTAVMLEQRVCQKLGWSVRYWREAGEAGCWAAEVCTGVAARVRFSSADTSSATTEEGVKKGRREAAAAAMEGLGTALAAELAKPEVSMEAALGPHFRERVRVASAEGWQEFWAARPSVVGVDVEGNRQSPPCLVQIATESLVILEAPASAGKLSPDLSRLLADETITKIFCDHSGSDRRCLGLLQSCAAVVELEELANALVGESKVARGLARILTLGYASARGVRVVKDSHGASQLFFGAIEQGLRRQLRGVQDIPPRVQEYAALDAWATLLAWVHLTHDGPKDEMPAWTTPRLVPQNLPLGTLADTLNSGQDIVEKTCDEL
jgi:hypothetical protein